MFPKRCPANKFHSNNRVLAKINERTAPPCATTDVQ